MFENEVKRALPHGLVSRQLNASDIASAVVASPNFWGTIVGASIALCGVILTLNRNAKLQREGDERRFSDAQRAEERSNKHDAAVLRVALRSELNQLLTMMFAQLELVLVTRDDEPEGSPYDYSQTERTERIKAKVRKYRDGGDASWIQSDATLVPTLKYFSAYERNLDKLGLLSEQEVELLTFAFIRYQQRIGYIIANSSFSEENPRKTDYCIEYILKDPNKRRHLVTDLRDIIYPAEKAVETLAKTLAAEQRLLQK